MLCAVAEYDELPVRHNEDKVNAALSETVRWPVDSRTVDDPHTKANLLLQVSCSLSAVCIAGQVLLSLKYAFVAVSSQLLASLMTTCGQTRNPAALGQPQPGCYLAVGLCCSHWVGSTSADTASQFI